MKNSKKKWSKDLGNMSDDVSYRYSSQNICKPTTVKCVWVDVIALRYHSYETKKNMQEERK